MKKEIKEIPKFENKPPHLFGTYYTFFFIDGVLYGQEHSTMKYYQIDLENFRDVFNKLFDLRDILYLKEGFVDRSLNTVIFSPLDKFEINIEEFSFERGEIQKIHKFLNTL